MVYTQINQIDSQDRRRIIRKVKIFESSSFQKRPYNNGFLRLYPAIPENQSLSKNWSIAGNFGN
jgi:hypothetical protein